MFHAWFSSAQQLAGGVEGQSVARDCDSRQPYLMMDAPPRPQDEETTSYFLSKTSITPHVVTGACCESLTT